MSSSTVPGQAGTGVRKSLQESEESRPINLACFHLHQAGGFLSEWRTYTCVFVDLEGLSRFLTANNKSCLFNVPNSDTNPFDNAFDFGSDSCFLGKGFSSLTQLRNRDLSYVPVFLSSPVNNNSTMLYGGGGGFTPSESQGFTSLAKVLKPLEVLASSGAQSTLFQITLFQMPAKKEEA
ncbi:hypothetical protein YC2023_015385 [Brassica napus]